MLAALTARVLLGTRCLPPLRALYLFGSRATDSAWAESDWDFGFRPVHPVSPIDRFELAQTIAMALGAEVDLVDLSEAPSMLRVQVVDQGVRLFAADPAEADAWEAHALSDYAHLNEAREGILRDARLRGSVYG